MLDPSGLLSGMVSATVNRTPWRGRSKWLESTNWDRMARSLSGSNPVPQREESPHKPCGSDSESVVNPAAYE